MSNYESYMRSVSAISATVTDVMVSSIGRQLYEDARGYPPEQALPDRGEDFTFDRAGFTGDVLASESSVRNMMWRDMSLVPNSIGAHPERFIELPEVLYELYFDIHGEWLHSANQPDHPGLPPMKQADMESALDQLVEISEILRVTPTLADLVDAVEHKNYQVAASFFDIDERDLFTPGGGSELSGLFTNGDVHVLYHDDEIALLQPEYNHDVTLRVLQQRAGVGVGVSLRNDPLELAYVVGIDDTPVGLFGHSLDGTNLDIDQRVTREMIHDAMDFDYSWDYSANTFYPAVGDRVRLQGDFAVEYVSRDVSTDAPSGRFNLPIDNHLGLFTAARLAPGEDRTQEPVSVELSTGGVVNIAHDEHRQVVAEFAPGTYRFYLLPRGLQDPENRPQWTETPFAT
jgi:hypothetical protein